MQSDEGFGLSVNYAGESGDQRNDVSADRAAQEQMAADVSGGKGFFFFFFSVFVILCENHCFFFFLKKKKKSYSATSSSVCFVLLCETFAACQISDGDFVRCLHFS